MFEGRYHDKKTHGASGVFNGIAAFGTVALHVRTDHDPVRRTAQQYPNKTIRIIVTIPPGGADVVAKSAPEV
jgi:tripartite-type tricarboxylate transporter receptor subunit TctC